MLKQKWAVDTNVLIYFLDNDSVFHQQAVDLFFQAQKNSHSLFVAQQNITELIQVLTVFYKFPLNKAITQAKNLLASSISLVHPLPQTISTYFSLYQKVTNPHYHFDLYLAATLLDNHITTFITADQKPFKHISAFKTILIRPKK